MSRTTNSHFPQTVNDFRLRLRERIAKSREWIDRRNPKRFELVLLLCLVVGLTGIISSVYVPSLYGFIQGRTAPRTVIASKTVTAVDTVATANLKAQVAQLVEPVYYADSEALTRATYDLETFFQSANGLRSQLVQSGPTSPTTSPPATTSTSAAPGGPVTGGLTLDQAKARLRAVAPSTVPDQTIELLLTTSDDVFDQVHQQALGVLRVVYADRITEGNLDSAKSRLRTLANTLAVSPAVADAVFEVAVPYIKPNQLVDQQQTQARRQAAVDEVAPVMVTVRQGERVIQKGEVVTAQDAMVLEALGLSETRSGWKIWLGVFLLVLVETAVFSRLLARFNKTTKFANNMLLALVMLLLGFTAVSRGLIVQPLSPYFVPVAALGMVVAVILNARSALLLVALAAVNVGLMTDLNMAYALVALLVGAVSLYFVSRVAQRSALLLAGLATMLVAAFTVFCVELFREASLGGALQTSTWGLANGLLAGVLTVLLLLILDTAFNLTTPLRLLELANPAQPLLKKLMQVAPGTYNHSILMGSLAEAAAEAVGADPLLARVGAYYHDIGKTVRPEYFVENQIYVDNPHDRLSPNLSKLAITAHVRDGVHLARLYGLPAPVLDIIRQHHGTSVVAYFYHKAQESAKETVDEESFRYEEEKPKSKEAAIIMLADGVEAAVRAMRNPTRRKIQGVIQEIIKQKTLDGQLDESDLTQGDLHKVREAFDTTLRGLVGHRIRYPEKNSEIERRQPRVPPSVRAMGGKPPSERLELPPPTAELASADRPAPSGTEPQERSGHGPDSCPPPESS